MGILFFLESQEAVRAASVLGVATLVTLPFVYLAFLGTALDTPLVRPFRSNRAFAVPALLAGGARSPRPSPAPSSWAARSWSR